MMKESLIDADGNQMSMEDYLGQIAEYGEFNNTMDKPLEKFAENLLDILIIPPIIEMCTGKELLTGDDLSDTERLIKGVTALVGLFTLGQAGAAFKGASFLSKEALIYMGKTIAVDMAATTVSYGVGQMCEELNLPVPLTLIVSIAAGMTVSKAGTKYILKDGLGNTVMELDEVVESGLDSNPLDELADSGVKYNPEDIVAITKTRMEN